jgi:hypothetical protein
MMFAPIFNKSIKSNINPFFWQYILKVVNSLHCDSTTS